MSFSIDKKLAAAVRDEFERVLDDSVSAYEFSQIDLFPKDAERIIQRELDRKLHQARLPHGGKAEIKIIQRLKKMVRWRDWDGSWKAGLAAQKWEEVIGWYYSRKPLSLKDNKTDFEWLKGVCQSAKTTLRGATNPLEIRRLRDQLWFAELQLAGDPSQVADFELECKFLLVKYNDEVDRLVRLRNVAGERTKLIPLNSEAFHAPQKFRKFCLSWGNYGWKGNEKDLENLHEDVNRNSAWNMVQQIVSFGWKEVRVDRSQSADVAKSGVALRKDSVFKDGVWFFGDVAIDPDGKFILPEKNYGIFWHGEQGYLIGEEAREGEFRQGRPRMHPEVSIRDLGLPGMTPDGIIIQENPSEKECLTWFFREISDKLKETVGAPEAQILIGSMLGYGAAPELLEIYSFFTGAWVHGMAGKGKTKTLEWLMNIWGLHLTAGMDLTNQSVTAVGIYIAAEQYSNLPVWLDEFLVGKVSEDKLAILKSAWNRALSSKFTVPGQQQRKLNTAFFISGESTLDNQATRGRYPFVHISGKREKDHLSWFREHAPYFYLLGRYVLQNRKEFVGHVLKFMNQWRDSESLKGIEDRVRMVHGVSYAAYRAMGEMLHSHCEQEVVAFENAMVLHCRKANEDVLAQGNVSVFWEELAACVADGKMPLKFFRLEAESVKGAPDRPNQGYWRTCHIYFDPTSVIAALQEWLVKRRESLALKIGDLRDQNSRQPFWLGSVPKRLPGSKATKRCWGINLDKHPLGYRPISDEEYQQFKADEEDGDPRKGPLYELVEKLDNRDKGGDPMDEY